METATSYMNRAASVGDSHGIWWLIATLLASACAAFGTTVQTTTVGGDEINGNTEVVTGVSVTESDPTVPEWAKQPEPPISDADFTTNNTELVETIEAVAPTPGDYETVSNAAMSAEAMVVSITNNLAVVTNSFARTNEVVLLPVYSSTPTYSDWVVEPQDTPEGPVQVVKADGSIGSGNGWYVAKANGANVTVIKGNADSLEITWSPEEEESIYRFTATRVRTDIIGYVLGSQTNIVLTSTNAIVTRAELDKGWWSEWKTQPAEYMGFPVEMRWYDNNGWRPYVGGIVDANVGFAKGDQESTRLSWTEGVDSELNLTVSRHRVAAPVPTAVGDLTNDVGYVTTNDAMLTPVYAPPGLTDWTIYREGSNVTAQVERPLIWYDDGYVIGWDFELTYIPGDHYDMSVVPPIIGAYDSLSISYTGTDGNQGTVHYTATRTRTAFEGYILGAQSNKVLAATNDLVKTQTLTNYYTRTEADEAIAALAAYYITTSNGTPFATYAELTNTVVYYSGGEPRTPTRNDYAVVLANELGATNEWRFIYTVSVVDGQTNEEWQAQYPIETNDYDALANKPSIEGLVLTGNVTAAELRLPIVASTAEGVAESGWSFVLSDNVSYLTNETQEVVGGVTNIVTIVETNSYSVLSLYHNGDKVWTSDPAEQGIGWIVALVLALFVGSGGLIWKFVAPIAAKLNSTSAAPAFSASATYAVGDHMTYNGVLYECMVAYTATSSSPAPDQDIYDEITAPNNHWKVTNMTSPDAMLDISPYGVLRVVSAEGNILWQQGYRLASESSAVLLNEAVNLFEFAAYTDVSAFDDTAPYSSGDRVSYDGNVYKFNTTHAAGAWIGTDADLDLNTQSFSLPVVPYGRVGDFVLEIDNTANTLPTAIGVAEYAGGEVSLVVPKGAALDKMFTVAGGAMCELYFTQTAFGVGSKPTWKVIRQDVEAA